MQSAANTKPHTYEPELNYSKTINVDTLRLALKKARQLPVNFKFDHIKLDCGKYFEMEDAREHYYKKQ